MKKLNEAINVILEIIGEQVLEDDIPIEGIYEAEIASVNIDRATTSVLMEGWAFNTDTGWTFAPDSEGYIGIPATALKVDPSDSATDCIVKNGRLYDKTNKTYKFSKPVACDVVWNIDFDEVPTIAQEYIIAKAARTTAFRLIGDTEAYKILKQDEQEARLQLVISEDDIGDYNYFDDLTVARAITRTSNPVGIRG